jgi:predicted DNA-binding transcriptional regulator YafY
MPTSDAYNKSDRLYRVKKLFEPPGARWRTKQIAEKLGVSEDTVGRYLSELDRTGQLPIRKDGQFWILAEDAHIEQLQVRLHYPEATALYIAGRLLAAIHDERNRHIILALTKLVDALPSPLHPYMTSLVEMAELRQQGREDRSDVFAALALGWIQQRKVRLIYHPAHKRSFECLFSPYLLEPSGIGRTLYAIGESTPSGALRTYKWERIEYAQVSEEPFSIPQDFDGPALLSKAWGVMYGDEELVTVRLRFSHYVTPRLKETLWHPSQTIEDTPEGCIWTAQIGDDLEIENWIRGWGADCEVVEPPALRDRVMQHVRRLSQLYGIEQPASAQAPNMERLSRILGGQS